MRRVRVYLRRQGPPAHGEPGTIVDEHLSAMCDERRWLPVADVIVCVPGCRHRLASPGGPLVHHPGALVAAQARCDGVHVVATRSGETVNIAVPEPWMAASLTHAWLVGGGGTRDLGAFTFTVEASAPDPVARGVPEPSPSAVRRAW